MLSDIADRLEKEHIEIDPYAGTTQQGFISEDICERSPASGFMQSDTAPGKNVVGVTQGHAVWNVEVGPIGIDVKGMPRFQHRGDAQALDIP
jgi:hypothetical protein